MKNKASVFLLILFSIFSSASFLSCGSDNEGDPPYNNSFIQAFTEIDQITAKTSFGATFDKTNHTFYFESDNPNIDEGVYIWLKGTSSKGFFAADAPRTSDSYKEYNKYINRIGDKDFTNRPHRYYGILGNNKSIAITDTLSFITVKCDKSYNSTTPVNTSLNHLITVFFDNPYTVVKNNYNNYKGEDSYVVKRILANKNIENVMIDGFPYAFVGHNLSEIDWQKYPFIGNEWLLVFNQRPDVTDTYTFNISMAKSDGSILNVSTKPIKVKGRK